ncbi:hypothetical protein GV828_00700 [Flavobacterium sp. NST-5]|uniref:Lipocalin-like domain-containing protein n=1 Tax=Flavobacterium ichthyis TaxID=2698827 RepID=A0ABW9Z576_9FLAO|nr:hypothetical protein [Flavobacterium ichthyis]NBL63712.1 hypothetical protein [Flavobacterium ichthyis]
MKNLILIIATVLLFCSCQSDDNNNSTDLYGKWQLIAQQEFDDLIEEEEESTPLVWHSVENGEIYEFRANATFSKSGAIVNNYQGTYQYQSSANVLTLQCNNNDIPSEYQIEWLENNSQIILTRLNGDWVQGSKIKLQKIE